MKKVLLAGTAMGMAAFYAGQAVAQDEGSLSFSAFLNTRLAVGSATKGDAVDTSIPSNGSLSTNSEIAVSASQSTDAGTLGIHIELETDEASTGNTDETSATIAADWGTLMLGNNDGANDPKVSGFSFGLLGMQNDLTGSAAAARTAAGAGGSTSYYSITSEGGDEAKIMYTTPDFGGVTARVSYTPEISQYDSTATSDTFNVTDAMALGISYAGDMGAVSVALAAGYSTADFGSPAISNTATTDNGTSNGYHFGANVTMGMFSVGAGYLNSEDDDGAAAGTEDKDREQTVWNLGGKIAVNDQLSISAIYSNEEADQNGDNDSANDEEVEEMSLGVSYTITDGLSASAAFLTGEVSEDVATSTTNAHEDGEYDAATFQIAVSF